MVLLRMTRKGTENEALDSDTQKEVEIWIAGILIQQAIIDEARQGCLPLLSNTRASEAGGSLSFEATMMVTQYSCTMLFIIVSFPDPFCFQKAPDGMNFRQFLGMRTSYDSM